jgi:hypothetical protein
MSNFGSGRPLTETFEESYYKFKLAIEENRRFMQERREGKKEVLVEYDFYCRKTKVSKKGVVKAVDVHDLMFILIHELPSSAEGTARWYAIQYTDRYAYPYRFSGIGESAFKELEKCKTAYLSIEDDFWW